jgi:hypothetical protein
VLLLFDAAVCVVVVVGDETTGEEETTGTREVLLLFSGREERITFLPFLGVEKLLLLLFLTGGCGEGLEGEATDI